MTTKTSQLSTEEKVSLLFDYIFNSDKAEEEERFWNKLSRDEITELTEIQKEDMMSFDTLISKSNA